MMATLTTQPGEQQMRKIVNHVPRLVDELRQKRGERVSLIRLSQEIGVDRPVLTRWYNDQVTKFDETVLLKFAEFFGTNTIIEIVDE